MMSLQKSAIAFGTFDGLHMGHSAVLNSVLNTSYRPMAVTFEYPPNMPKKNGLIISCDEKINLIKKMGIEPVVLDFEKVRNITSKDFLERIKKIYSPAVISTGFNFKFGRGAEGDAAYLKSFCIENKIEYRMSEPVMCGGKIVSSTEIRRLISDGAVKTAAEMLGRNFSFGGEIIHGDARGRTLGFPTINVAYPEGLTEPLYGVYLSLVHIDGKSYYGITNIGVRPTFKIDYVISETYILDFEGEIYGKSALIELLDFIRREVKFNSPEELAKAIRRDINTALLRKDDINAKYR